VTPPGADLKEAASRPLTLMQTIKAVAWAFIGLRRSAGLRDDVQRLNPIHLAIAGVAGAAVFVIGLVLLVRWVVGSGVAAT
jgi:hypothetical protein